MSERSPKALQPAAWHPQVLSPQVRRAFVCLNPPSVCFIGQSPVRALRERDENISVCSIHTVHSSLRLHDIHPKLPPLLNARNVAFPPVRSASIVWMLLSAQRDATPSVGVTDHTSLSSQVPLQRAWLTQSSGAFALPRSCSTCPSYPSAWCSENELGGKRT